MTDDPAAHVEPDDATAISRRRGIDPDATQPVDPDDTHPGRRPGPQRHADPSAGDATSDDGSTIVVRRKSRPRSPSGSQPSAAARSDAAAAAGPHATVGAAPPHRIAAPPEAHVAYPPRTPEQPEITRRPPSPRPLQAPVDRAAGEAATRRRRRRTALIAVVAASVLVALAVAGIFALALIP